MMVTVPKWLKAFYPSLEWEVKGVQDSVYLTFDDGPHPEITPKVLDMLDSYQAKATFFCVGENVKKYPETYRQIIERGHAVGNHTYHHLNGWKANNKTYFDDIALAGNLIGSNLFRPPYGKISYMQINVLKRQYRIIMWSVLTYDFSSKLTKQECLNNAFKGLKPGSVIVFHDSKKAEKNMFYALSGFLEKSHDMKLKSLAL